MGRIGFFWLGKVGFAGFGGGVRAISQWEVHCVKNIRESAIVRGVRGGVPFPRFLSRPVLAEEWPTMALSRRYYYYIFCRQGNVTMQYKASQLYRLIE